MNIWEFLGHGGVKVPPDRKDPLPTMSSFFNEAAGYVSRDWISGYRPGDKAQTMGCCVGRGSMNLAEVLIQNHNPGALKPGEQLNGEALYLWIRKNYYGDQNPDVGAQIEEGARALIEAGVLPPDTIHERVSQTQNAISEALMDGPILQGHMVDDAWRTTSQDGSIQDAVGPYIGAHCTVMLGQWYYPDYETEYPSGNSWGDNWGWHGVFQLGWSRWQKTCLDAWRVVVNPQSMKEWTGFSKWLVPGVVTTKTLE